MTCIRPDAKALATPDCPLKEGHTNQLAPRKIERGPARTRLASFCSGWMKLRWSPNHMAVVVKTNGIPFWDKCTTHFSLFQCILVGIGMFTGGTGFSTPRFSQNRKAPWEALCWCLRGAELGSADLQHRAGLHLLAGALG